MNILPFIITLAGSVVLLKVISKTKYGSYIRANSKPTYLDIGFKSIAEMESFNRRVLFLKEEASRAYTYQMILKTEKDYRIFLLPYAQRNTPFINKSIVEAFAAIESRKSMINNKLNWNDIVFEREQVLLKKGVLTKGIDY